MDELKLCPFCDGEANIYERENKEVDVICVICQCRSGIGEREETIKAWNTRKGEDNGN